MAKDILLGGAYVASADGTGKTGLTVTIDVWRVAIADLAKSEIVTAGSASEVGDGVYCYRVASADLQTYYYFGVLKTSDTSVVQKHVFAVNLDYADSPGLVTLIWNALTSGMSTAGSIGKRITDYLTGDVFARLGAPAGASVSADIAAVPTAAEIDTELSNSHGAGTWGAGGNGGALTLTYTVSSSAGGVVAGAIVELYAEVGMTTLIDSQVTNVLGVATFSNLVAGTYYLKIIRSGYTTATDSEVVA